jgi:putative flippase GtrA
MNIITNNKERGRFLKFVFVGAIGFVIDLSVLNLMGSILNFDLLISSTVSFLAAVTSNFIFNRFWTFPESRSKKISSQLTQFAIVSVIGYVIRTAILLLIVKPYENLVIVLMGESFENAEIISENLGLITVVLIVMFWNYFVNRFWTYNDVEA